MAVETLVSFLVKRTKAGWQWDPMFGSPTIVMDFDWGNTTSDMAFSCLGVAKLIDKNLGAAIMACTISSDDRKPFGDDQRWEPVHVQGSTQTCWHVPEQG